MEIVDDNLGGIFISPLLLHGIYSNFPIETTPPARTGGQKYYAQRNLLFSYSSRLCHDVKAQIKNYTHIPKID